MIHRRGYVVAGVAIAGFAVILAYAFIQLLTIHKALSSFTGENMLWNVTQTEREARKLAEALLLSPEYYDGEQISFRFNILESRVKILNDSPQYEFYVGINGRQNLDELVRVVTAFETSLDSGKSNAGQLYSLLSPAFDALGRLSNKAMIQQRNIAGQRRDKQLQTIYVIMASIAGLLASGAALSWLLVSNIRALNTAHAELHAYNEKLEDTVADRTAALRHSLENERQMNLIYKNFLTTVSHQFRTPIAIIDMIAQRFVRWPDEVTKDVLVQRSQRIRTAVRRLGLIIESTINNDRLTERGLDLAISEVDFSKIVRNACAYHSDVYPERNLHVTMPDYPVPTKGDATHLEQILLNLLSNAEKYSTLSTPINVRLRIQGDQIVCTVIDFGIGIPADDQPQIFDRFYRAKNVSHLPGSGLGLSLSSTLARLHGGKISFRSSPSAGTTFELRLPLNGLDNE